MEKFCALKSIIEFCNGVYGFESFIISVFGAYCGGVVDEDKGMGLVSGYT